MLMIMYGGFMELDGISITIPVLLMGTDKYDIRQYSEFKLLYFLIKSIKLLKSTELSVPPVMATF